MPASSFHLHLHISFRGWVDDLLKNAPNTLKTKYKYENGKLKQVGEEACMYDAVGNPLQHRMRMVWTGRKLTSCMGRRINVNFEYDGRGRRIRKGMTEYKYDSQDRLISSSDGMKYFYDEVGVAGFIYDGATYYYVRDVQKNVIAILDSSGTKVIEYSYDAWGNQQVSGSNIKLGNLNPFRYRSYFYDTETELYYLNTRYYDPVYCRFINMDSFDYADPEQLNGLNLYAYCANNPVMGYDPDGTFSWKGFGMIVAAIAIVAAVAVATAVTAGVVGAAVAGFAGATALGTEIVGTVVGTAAFLGGVALGSGEVVSQVIDKGSENINLGSVALTTFSGSMDSALTAGSMFTGSAGKSLIAVSRVGVAGFTNYLYGKSEGYDNEIITNNIFNGMQITALFGILPFLSKEVTAASLMLKPFISGLAKFGSSIMNFMKKLGEV